MFKKLLFILPLYLTFSIVLAHGFIPHRHTHKIETTKHHHHDGAKHHHNEDGAGDKDLSHSLEFFHHAGNTIQFISSPCSVMKIFSSFDFVPFTCTFLNIEPCESPHLPSGFSPQLNFYSFLYSPQTALRAPPCIA